MTGNHDVVILGAGAAGLMCAIAAGQRGCRVVVLDHAPKIGSKILISGGGRCNFTNLHIAPDRFLSQNRHFATSALKRYTQHDFLALVNRHGIAWHEKTLGQLFCDGSARQIVAMLEAEATAAGVDIRTSHTVTGISRSDRFEVTTSGGRFDAPALVLATGGPAIPKMGATAFSHDVARQFGLRLVPPRPALVPLTLSGSALAFAANLSGVAVDATATFGRTQFRENILFTHRGVSGPAILQISSYWREGGEIVLDLCPGLDLAAFLRERRKGRPKAELRTAIGELLPARLAAALAEGGPDGRALVPAGTMANLSDKAIDAVAGALSAFRLTPAGSEGYAKAEVTLGGVDTADLSSRTMEAKAVPGLHVIGEAVDVTGWLGGYNFQWAWSSGWCAGLAIAEQRRGRAVSA
ncbi:NAD(P)/FAD-dependent oxidoreductase [Methylobrevis pamukkalensis]|uniref:Tricarballylate dehydrogenase n=1 Tax=Methylobrevis pamukkalensis TaxID=1439726 RepID=A0A1E3H6X4_9HYPH|nr:NAD(P)/FAD-dependent oxidoreductase [Methylobrevis pamukkalensis]ODN72089.1 tricarballylate dehydrogenase [Methylobrevis pamukkalensis]